MKKVIFNEIWEKVLSKEQKYLVTILEEFSDTHFLAWGTAIALYLWHRKSIDYDLFSFWPQWDIEYFLFRIKKTWLKIDQEDEKELNARWLSWDREKHHEYIIHIWWVRLHFIDIYRKLYDDQKVNLNPNKYIQNWIKTVSLEELACMKSFAMMYRAKWKDAVDMYFIIKETWLDLSEILKNTANIFEWMYKIENTLSTIIDDKWDKTEKVEFIWWKQITDKEITDFLTNEAKKILTQFIS